VDRRASLHRQLTVEELQFFNTLKSGALSMVQTMSLRQKKQSMTAAVRVSPPHFSVTLSRLVPDTRICCGCLTMTTDDARRRRSSARCRGEGLCWSLARRFGWRAYGRRWRRFRSALCATGCRRLGSDSSRSSGHLAELGSRSCEAVCCRRWCSSFPTHQEHQHQRSCDDCAKETRTPGGRERCRDCCLDRC